MKYRVNDLVYFESYSQKGVGKIIEVDDRVMPYLVYSTNIVNGHNGADTGFKQDNGNNWWFKEEELKPFIKKVGQKYKYIGTDDFYGFGEIMTLQEIADDCISYYYWFDGLDILYDLDHEHCEVEFYEDAPSAKEKEMFTKEFILSTNRENKAYQTQFTQDEIDNLVKEHGLKLDLVEQIEIK